MRSDSASARIIRDTALVRRVRDGDGTALSELVRLYGIWLTDVALRIVQSPDLAQDVVQDVFTHLWDTRARLDIRASVAAFLYRATTNRAHNLLKHERAQQSAAIHFVEATDFDATQVSNAGEAALDAEDFRRALDAALRQLPPRARDVFLMRAEQGMSYDEIAEALSITVSTAYKQVYTASKRLAQALAMWVDPAEPALDPDGE